MPSPSTNKPFPFQNPGLTLPERVADLLARLTLEEKIELIPQYQAAVPRLGLRAWKAGTEVLHGVGWLGPATVFPQAIGLGSTWNPELLERIGAAVGDEMRGFYFRDPEKNGLNVWSPVVDLLRDPRAGRNEEGYSEDPLLVGRLSVAYARGLRGGDPFYLKTAPTLKHFFAYNNEDARETTDCSVDPRNLREYYWKAFRPAIAAGAASGVMTSYNLVNGRPNTLSPHLADVRSWTGETLLVVSDEHSLPLIDAEQKYFPDSAAGCAAALRAGVDSFTEKPGNRHLTVEAVRAALARGLIAEADVDRAAAHALSLRIRLGEFDPRNPYAGITDAAILTPEHRALAREAAREQLVLLKNAGGLLPLEPARLRKLAVIGGRADQVLTDHYSGSLPYVVTPLAALRERLAGRAEVTFAADDAGAAAEQARAADAAVVFVGNHPTCNAGWAQCPEPTEGKEAVDRRALHLPAEDLIRRVCAANPNTVVVLVSSFPYAIGWTREHAPAILWSSHAGQEMGAAIADALLGAYSPGGRLTQTWYASAGDLAPITDYDIIRGKRTYLYFEGEPLFPFGHGLSYTAFAYDDLSIEPGTAAADASFTIRLTVANAGSRAADEVVQLYVHARRSRVKRPLRELKGFRRIHLRPGESRPVEFQLPAAELAFWDVTRERWAVERGEYDIRIGASAQDIRLRGVVRIEGEEIPPRDLFRPTRAENFDDCETIRLADESKLRGNAVAGEAGGWIAFRGADFGSGAARFRMRAANGGGAPARLEVRLDRPDGPLAAQAEVPATESRYDYRETETAAAAAGVHDVFLVFRGGMRISGFQFFRQELSKA